MIADACGQHPSTRAASRPPSACGTAAVTRTTESVTPVSGRQSRRGTCVVRGPRASATRTFPIPLLSARHGPVRCAPGWLPPPCARPAAGQASVRTVLASTTPRRHPLNELDDIIADEAKRVPLEALSASYRNVHDNLDLLPPGNAELSSTYTLLARALRLLGSSGADALGLPRP